MCPHVLSSVLRPRALCLAALALVTAVVAPSAALAQPVSTNLGALTTAAPVNIPGISISGGSVSWYKFTISAVSPAMFLDIDSEGTFLTPGNDSMIGLYDGAGNLVAFDDDNGSGGLSALSFGAATPARPGAGDGGPFQGQSGPLAAGTYYVVIGAFPVTFGPTGWAVTSSTTINGTGYLSLRLGPPGAMPLADAGPNQAVLSGATVVLDGAASSGGTGCPTQITWSQIAGPTVILDTADQFHPTFQAPPVPQGGATLTFQATVNTCPSGAIAAVVNITVTNINNPPQAEAGPDQTLFEATTVTLNGAASFDPDSDPLAFAWTQTSGPAVTLNLTDPLHPTFDAPLVGQTGATLTFALGVSDGLASASDTVSILVQNVNHAPVANAGAGGTVNEGSNVTLNGSASSDPDSDPLIYSWQQISGPAVSLSTTTSPTPAFTAPQVNNAGATIVFRLTVSDGSLTSTSDVTITVHNAVTPPNCSTARPSDRELWPPNHRLQPIFIRGFRGDDDDCHNPTIIAILSVTQDEPIRGLGDGDTGPDAVIVGPCVLLRAERAGDRNGRVYTINFRATNAGGSCNGSVKVTVPKKQSHNGNAIDDGQNYNSVGP